MGDDGSGMLNGTAELQITGDPPHTDCLDVNTISQTVNRARRFTIARTLRTSNRLSISRCQTPRSLPGNLSTSFVPVQINVAHQTKILTIFFTSCCSCATLPPVCTVSTVRHSRYRRTVRRGKNGYAAVGAARTRGPVWIRRQRSAECTRFTCSGQLETREVDFSFRPACGDHLPGTLAHVRASLLRTRKPLPFADRKGATRLVLSAVARGGFRRAYGGGDLP